jgi:hypothetical protein
MEVQLSLRVQYGCLEMNIYNRRIRYWLVLYYFLHKPYDLEMKIN